LAPVFPRPCSSIASLLIFVDIDRKTSNTIKDFVFEWYGFLNTISSSKNHLKVTASASG